MKNPFLGLLSPAALALASCGSPSSAQDPVSAQDIVTQGAEPHDPAAAGLAVTDVATFDEPWAMAFLPGTSTALVTERKGALKLWQAGAPVMDVAGVPTVDYGGQGGFGDVVPAPDYTTSGMIYLSWAEAGDGSTRGGVVARTRLVLTGGPAHLEGLQVIWRQFPKVTGRGHYSHRIVFSPDGKYLFVSSGDRQKLTPAQDMAANLGKVVRLLPDGTPAPGNPFADKGGVAAQVWSLGHRNLLGLAFDAQGRLWDLEHGPAGGDELNLVKPGQNYGWPVVSNGDHYNGKPIPRHATRPDFAAPTISWNPVIAPGDMIFYSGYTFPQWKGQVLIAALGAGGIVRVGIEGEKAKELERIDLGNRVREIEQAPDGSLYVLEDGEGGRLRHITPAK